MAKVKTHTFAGRRYKIEEVERIDGVTDIPGNPKIYNMLILAGGDLKALHSALHEGQEAIGLCDKCIHGYADRRDARTWDVARFLWRLGYRRMK